MRFCRAQRCARNTPGRHQVAVRLQKACQARIGGGRVDSGDDERVKGCVTRDASTADTADTAVQPADYDVHDVRVELHLHIRTHTATYSRISAKQVIKVI